MPPTYTCPNGQIVNNPNSCGSTPIPPSYQCANGSIVNNPSLCPTSPVPPQFICPNGQLVANPSNCPVTPVPQTYICSNGQIVNNPNQCPAQIQYQTCWDGSRIPVNQSCPQQYQICWNGSRIPVTNTCPQQTQICWNGLAVPLTQSCPQQYQTCWDGSIIPLTQSCPVKTTTTIIVKKEETITKEHVVVTDLATKITQNSAQCNGIGLIAGKVNSNGWFEYGETTDLGKVTNSANIGNYSETPFSNIISGLKSDTRYYCRAVMSNKDGVYKGKIVSFRTLAKSKVVITYPTPKPSKKTETKTEFYCADGSIAVAKTVLVGETVNAGGKLLKVTIERSIPDLIQGSTFNYRITITNIADTKIEDVEAKILIPSEMSFVDATTSNGITVEGNTIKVPVGDLDKGANKVFILPVKIAKDAEVDKSVITTVYASYNLPVKGEQIVRDEVSSYMVGNIVKADSNNSTNSTTTHRSTLASILFPQTLLGWLILFAIILILVILIRNIRQWYLDKKRIKEETTIHHHIA